MWESLAMGRLALRLLLNLLRLIVDLSKSPGVQLTSRRRVREDIEQNARRAGEPEVCLVGGSVSSRRGNIRKLFAPPETGRVGIGALGCCSLCLPWRRSARRSTFGSAAGLLRLSRPRLLCPLVWQ